MTRHHDLGDPELAAIHSATQPDPKKPLLINPESFSNTSKNGLLKLFVKFGMTRLPTGGPTEVHDAFKDLATLLRGFADGLDVAAKAALDDAQAPSPTEKR